MKSFKRSLFLIGVAAPIILTFWSVFRIMSNNSPLSTNRPIRFWAASFISQSKSIATVGGGSNPYELPRRGELVVWDMSTRSERLVLDEDSSVRSVACSPDGRLLAIGEFNGSIKLIDPISGAILETRTVRGGVNSVTFSPDGKVVAGGSLNGTIILWNLLGDQLKTLVLPGEKVLHVAISSDGHNLVATTRKGKAYILDLLHSDWSQKLDAYGGPSKEEANVEAIAFAPDGHIFVTGSQKWLRVWSCPSGKLVKELAGSAAYINSAAFSPDGKTLATVDSEGTLALWDPTVGGLLKATNAHSGTSFSVQFSADGKSIATIGREDLTVKLWEVHDLTLLTALKRSNAPK